MNFFLPPSRNETDAPKCTAIANRGAEHITFSSFHSRRLDDLTGSNLYPVGTCVAQNMNVATLKHASTLAAIRIKGGKKKIYSDETTI